MNQDPNRRRRRLIGIGFVLAFALSTATIIYTGLNVRAPGTARQSADGQQQTQMPDTEATADPRDDAALPEDDSADPAEQQ